MNVAIRIAPLALAALLASREVPAEETTTPTTVKGVQVLSVEQARGLVGKVAFFDVRNVISYGKGHIKGAITLPYVQVSESVEGFDAAKDKFNVAKLPKDKSVPIVFYSDGRRGWKGYKAAVVASRAGYSKVSWMREGSAGWTARGFPVE